MTEVGLEITGRAWAALLRIEQTAPAALPPILERAMELLVDGVVERIPPYPPQRNDPLPKIYARPYMRKGQPTGFAYRSGFKTLKQQRYFFAALRSGDIRVPYKRRHSAGIGGAISGRVWGEDGQTWGAVGVNQKYAPYAPLVIGNDEQQAEYHKGHWWQFEPTVQEIAPKLVGPAAAKAVRDVVAALLA